jgi:hypothetical protein
LREKWFVTTNPARNTVFRSKTKFGTQNSSDAAISQLRLASLARNIHQHLNHTHANTFVYVTVRRALLTGLISFLNSTPTSPGGKI